MVFAFDTLAFSKKLRDKGVPLEQAEAHAEAIREFVMTELATKADIRELRQEIHSLSLALTVRLGGLIVVGIGALAALIKLG
jgi:hypothetical protein